MAQGVETVVSQLQGTGFYSLVLPFLLVFAIIYGLLSALDLFGDDKPNLIISIVFAIFGVVFFPMGTVLSALQGPWALWLILILMVMIAAQLAGISPEDYERWGYAIAAVGVLGTVYLFTLGSRGGALAAVFGGSGANGAIPTSIAAIPVIGPIISSIGLLTIIIILVALGMVYWMFMDGGAGE